MHRLIPSFIATLTLIISSNPVQAAKVDTTGQSVKPPTVIIKPLPAPAVKELPQVAPEPEPAPPPAPTPPTPQGYSGTGDYYLDWIIAHESGGNPYAMNSIGACGLGQSLPCSKVLSVCGSLDNVSCQVEWVRSYCVASYGSTYNAYLFWQAHSWY